MAGGRNVKCPDCGLVFAVPRPADSSLEITTDDQLPVAETVEEAPPLPAEPPPRRETTARRRGGMRETTTRSIPIRASSRWPWIFCGVGGAVLLIVGAVLLLETRGRKHDAVHTPPPPESSVDPDAQGILDRCREYLAAFHAGRYQAILEFYEVDESERPALRSAITALLEEETRYLDVNFISSEGKGGQGRITFRCTLVTRRGREIGRRVTWKWGKVGDQWKLTEIP